MSLINSKIGFIGCGNMAQALIKGLLDKGVVSKSNILASDIHAAKRRYIQKNYRIKVAPSNLALARNCDIVILAVKPQNIDEVLKEIYCKITADKLIISIAAGITIKHIQLKLPKVRIIRVMPNTPALVGCGITAICKSSSATKKDFNLTKRIFSATGSVVEVNENLIDAVTATSGSGPAYFFSFIDAIINAAISLGLNRKAAEELVMNTALGSSVLALKSKNPMEQLIKKVASKGGTTEAALKVFSRKGFKNIVKEAVRAAAKRSKELSR